MKNRIRDYFNDRLSAREEEDVQKYICANKGSQDLDDALRGLFDECLASSNQQTRRQSTVRKLIPYFVAAAAVLALLVVFPVAYRAGMDTGDERIASIEWVEVNVPFGEKEDVTLSDGTVLHLNSGSRLTYPAVFSGNTRTVFMDGEAYLDVAKDPEHPFIIKSQSIDIKVLGTSFNFKNFAQERTAELLLMEGSVEASVSIPNDTRTVRLKPGDKMIPLLTGKKPKDGKEAVAACVYAFDSDFKGRIAISGLMGRGTTGSNSEERQGILLARAVGISFAEGIENFFWYEYRAPERDPFYSEHHFGIVHDNFAPKPAWGAYKNFIIQRPVGSKQLPGAWRDDARTTYFPQWTRPDGRPAGMFWTLGRTCLRDLTFDGERVEFHDVWGKRIIPVKTGPKTWRVPTGESPVYFTGAKIKL